MKEFIKTHKLLCIIIACVFVAGATCAIVLPIALKHSHAYAEEWTTSETKHWHAATCEHTDLKKDEADHDFDEGVVSGSVKTYTCKVCEYKKTENVSDPADPHEHTYAEEWTTSETKHWHAATCVHDDKKDEADHDFDEGVVSGSVKTYTCKVCEYKKTETVSDPADPHEHTYAESWSTSETKHWHAATCGHDAKKDEADHDFDEGVVSGSVKTYTCRVCDYEKKEKVDTPAEAKDNVITVGTIDFTYNGKAQSIDSLVTAGNKEGMVVKYVGVDGTTYAESVTAPINAGTYQYTITVPATAEWKEAEKSGKFTIAQYELTELYKIKTAEYNGTDRIWVKFKTLADNTPVNIAIMMDSANVGAKVSYVWLPGLIDGNYTFNQEKITATIIPKKLSGLKISIRESDIDKEQEDTFKFSTTIEGIKNEEVRVVLEFFWDDLDNEGELQLTLDRPEKLGTGKCKIALNNANYELDGNNIGTLTLEGETA